MPYWKNFPGSPLKFEWNTNFSLWPLLSTTTILNNFPTTSHLTNYVLPCLGPCTYNLPWLDSPPPAPPIPGSFFWPQLLCHLLTKVFSFDLSINFSIFHCSLSLIEFYYFHSFYQAQFKIMYFLFYLFSIFPHKVVSLWRQKTSSVLCVFVGERGGDHHWLLTPNFVLSSASGL